ncbi:ribbon-helix-helix domain-containing protein [Sphaerisporangium fuscum]|uniref:ribbon-helix-helix domain-containing protein n=1 Tax=Sphaerisporangium fuscum TaxID=2835868 RepID=UPI001BDD8E7F|nr:ribbon-helix-helix domain-containing protein [Sphaerisporangium fuscum]
MKLSVSLPDEDIAILDEAIERGEASSRSAAIHTAIQLLRRADLEDSYASAFAEWDESGDAALWSSTTSDGLTDSGPR